MEKGKILGEPLPELYLLATAHLQKSHLDLEPGVIQASWSTIASPEHVPGPFEGLIIFFTSQDLILSFPLSAGLPAPSHLRAWPAAPHR